MKKLLSVFIAVLMCMTAMTTAISVSAKETNTVETSATVGNISWSVSGGVLYLIGSGDIPDFTPYYSAPWSTKYNEIRKVVISENVTSIGNYAFYNLSNLTYVQFDGNSKLNKIGERAFSYCTNLTDITLPNSVKSVGNEAFGSCRALVNFSTNASANFGDYEFYNCVNLKTVSTPNAKSFGSYAFSCCSMLTNANLGKATLEKYCLYNDNNLVSVTAGSLKQYAFYGASNLKSLNIKNAKSIESYALYNLPKITSINTNATSIESSAFYGTNNIKSATLPKLKKVSDNLFRYSTDIQTVKLGAAETIGKYSFANCSKLKTVTGTSKVKKINDAAFGGCKNLTKLSTSNKLTYIGYQSFFNCQKLTGSFNFSNVTFVDAQAFFNCKKLSSSLNFRKVKEIGFEAFVNCQKLKGNTLGTKIKKLGSKSFLGCKSLGSVYIPSTCKSFGYDSFIKNIKSITETSNNYISYKYNYNGKKITIYGNKGSQAQSYAKLYKNPFKYAVKSVSVNSTKVTIKKGKTFKLKTYVSPSNCANRKVTVKSSNAKIATIDSKGTIKGISKGKCKITVTSRDGSLKSKTVTVTVK